MTSMRRKPSSGANSKQVGGPAALVFVIGPLRLSRFHRNRRSRLGNELLRGLVEADERPIRIVGPRINIEHVFHRRYESAARPRRDDPLLFAVRLKRVLFENAPDGVIAGALHNAQLDHLVLQEPQRPARIQVWPV